MKSGEMWVENDSGIQFRIDAIKEAHVVIVDIDEDTCDVENMSEFFRDRKHKEDVVFGYWLEEDGEG